MRISTFSIPSRKKRAAALYSEDERQTVRQSHNNAQIQQLYTDYLEKPNSHKAHELLHTTYEGRRRFSAEFLTE